MTYSDYEQRAIDVAFDAREDRRAENRTVIAAFHAECVERRALGIYEEIPVSPPEDFERASREMEAATAARIADVGFAHVYDGPTCPGCSWPYDPAQDEHQAECCPACRAEDAANGE